MTVTMRPLRREDCAAALKNVSPGSRAELAALGAPAEDLVGWSFDQSVEAYAGEIDGALVCVFGVLPGGRTWLVGTKWMGKKGLEFVRASRAVVRDLVARWGTLEGWTISGNESSLRWLCLLGFKIDPPPVGGAFCHFRIED